MNWFDVKEEALIASDYSCCICHKSKDVTIDVYHIKYPINGGDDSVNNAISLCNTCQSKYSHRNSGFNHDNDLIEQLISLRNEWYKSIQESYIYNSTNQSEHVYFRHLVLKKYEMALDIFERGKFEFPEKNSLLIQNEIFHFAKNLLSLSDHHRLGYLYKSFKNRQQIFDTYSNIKVIDKSSDDFTYFSYSRIPDREDLLSLEDELTGINKFLLNNNIPIEDFAISLFYESIGCGDIQEEVEYDEIIIFRSLWFSFLSIQNISDKPIELKELKGTINKHQENFFHFSNIKNEEYYQLDFPKVAILPLQTVIVPTAIVACPFNEVEYDELIVQTEDNEVNYGEFQLSKLSRDNSVNEDFRFLGKYIKPKQLKHDIFGESFRTSIHSLDFTNIYAIDQAWGIGSCPHLFFLHEKNGLTFVKELFAKKESLQEEIIIIPEKIKAIIIAELENEITYIDAILINDNLLISNKQLAQGDNLFLEVKKGDIVTMSGYYEKLFENIALSDQPVYRNRVISKYLKQYNSNHSR